MNATMDTTMVIPAREIEPGMALGDEVMPEALVVCVDHDGTYDRPMLRVFTADRRTMCVSPDSLVEVTTREEV